MDLPEYCNTNSVESPLSMGFKHYDFRDDKPPNPVPVPKFDSPVKTQTVPNPVSPETPRTPTGRGTPKGHKSPFSISASSSFVSLLSSKLQIEQLLAKV